MNKVDTFDDFFGVSGEKPKQKEVKSPFTEINNLQNVMDHFGYKDTSFLPYPNPTTKRQKSHNAAEWWFHIAEIYNQGWTPDFTNSKEEKWYFYKQFSDGQWSVGCHCNYYTVHAPSGVYFKDKKSIEDVKSKFPELIDDYFMI